MRINRYIALATGTSRRRADGLIGAGRVSVNGLTANTGLVLQPGDNVSVDGVAVSLPVSTTTLLINKPVGYVCSRNGQGSKTVYDLLPEQYHELKPVGRLDKDSSGLLLLTNNGKLANELTHPSYGKSKVYEVKLAKALTNKDTEHLSQGIVLEDGISKFKTIRIISPTEFIVSLTEGRNRQIRRTFEALGNKVTKLRRTKLGPYELGELAPGKYREILV